jgi:tRNA threonylcarbamoyladenosine biosynthesis protein TsaB
MITFALDTSTSRTSLALLQADGRASVKSMDRMPRGHGAEAALFDGIAGLLAEEGVRASDVELWAVGIGPGSFTGIRAGIAAVEGLALPLGRPVRGAASFDGIAGAAAAAMPRDCAQLCVVGDARRDEIYFAMYDERGRRQGDVRLGAMEDLADAVRDPVWFVGAEIERYREGLNSVLGGFAVVAAMPVYPDASAIARLARSRCIEGPAREDELTPLYLRPVQYKTV